MVGIGSGIAPFLSILQYKERFPQSKGGAKDRQLQFAEPAIRMQKLEGRLRLPGGARTMARKGRFGSPLVRLFAGRGEER